MDGKFRQHVEALHGKFEALVGMAPVSMSALPRDVPQSGIYLLSEGGTNLYIGRSRKIRSRLKMHAGHYAGASFAVKLARLETGRKISYTTRDSTRLLMNDADFVAAFERAKARIRGMQVRYVDEADPNRQALLEIYATIVLGTPYNDFETH